MVARHLGGLFDHVNSDSLGTLTLKKIELVGTGGQADEQSTFLTWGYHRFSQTKQQAGWHSMA